MRTRKLEGRVSSRPFSCRHRRQENPTSRLRLTTTTTAGRHPDGRQSRPPRREALPRSPTSTFGCLLIPNTYRLLSGFFVDFMSISDSSFKGDFRLKEKDPCRDVCRGLFRLLGGLADYLIKKSPERSPSPDSPYSCSSFMR